MASARATLTESGVDDRVRVRPAARRVRQRVADARRVAPGTRTVPTVRVVAIAPGTRLGTGVLEALAYTEAHRSTRLYNYKNVNST